MRTAARHRHRLVQAVEEYQLEVKGVKFWTPYWVNWPTRPYFVGAPYTGKGTPGQLKHALLQRVESGSSNLESAEDFRKLMVQHGLGIDCSGLVYHVLARYLANRYKLRLADYVYAPKEEIIEFSSRPRWAKAGVSRATLNSLPDNISLTKLHQLFGVNPRWNANITRLTSLATSMTVPLSDARPGDLIKLSGLKHPHIGLIIEVGKKRIRYVDSSREWGRYGGVRYCNIEIVDRAKGLEAQNWYDKRFYFQEKGDRICRLKVLDGRD